MNFFAKVTKPSQGTQETLEKKRVAWNSGLKVGPKTEEQRARELAGLLEYYKTHSGPMTGKKHSEETRAKISEKGKGKVLSEEHRAKISAANKGIHLGRTLSLEHRTQLAQRAGKVMTPHGVFPSVRAVSEAAQVGVYCVRSWMKKFPEHYYYVTKGE